METPEDRSYFFDEGIRFACTWCGACCGGDPGRVAFSDEEAEAIAGFLKISVEEFLETYTHEVQGRRSLKETENGDCVFLKYNACTIHGIKPKQCRTYPFWASNMRSEEAWAETRRECPGIGTGRLYTREEILEILSQNLEGEAC